MPNYRNQSIKALRAQRKLSSKPAKGIVVTIIKVNDTLVVLNNGVQSEIYRPVYAQRYANTHEGGQAFTLYLIFLFIVAVVMLAIAFTMPTQAVPSQAYGPSADAFALACKTFGFCQ